MNAHALSVLEYFRVLDVVAGRASSSQGASRVRALVPSSNIDAIDTELGRVAAVRAIVASETGWNPPPIPAAQPALERLRVEGAGLSAANLLTLGVLLRSSRLTSDVLRDSRYPAAALAVLREYREQLTSLPPLESAVNKAIDDDGNVRDDASPSLRRIRRELRGAEGELVALLERLMARLEPHQQVSDMSVTVRNGRYVIPVRREGRVAVGGIVHDTSTTGSTIFVEPPAAIEAGNRIRELEAEELREIDRILAELTEQLRPHYDELQVSFEALITLDSLYARARFALEFNCEPVELNQPEDGFNIVDGRHPLLLARGIPVVAFSLEMLPDERTLLVSGPNTGGKTVLLKAAALLSLMTQTGIPVPVGPESRLAVFDGVYADIGDEQSIEASLSTFSAHIKNLREVLRNATHRTLVLIDELGSGTDPVEGAALGGAVLESLTTRGSLTIATTHLGALKELAIENPSIVNASLQFDPIALAPTYRLIKGIPGRSYGISIARRLEVPEEVLQRAEQRLPTGERDANALLASLEAREAELTEREREAAVITEDVRERARKVADRERNAGVREREAERNARQEARKYLLEARREIEQSIKALQALGAADAEVREATIRAARRGVEEMVTNQNSALERLDRSDRGALPSRPKRERSATLPVVGDRVEVETLGGRIGQVIELREGNAVVAVGMVKVTIPLKKLQKSDYVPPPIAVQVRGDAPEVHASNEVDLRGMRVSDVDDLVIHALDNAIHADLKLLRIIHGKGTGALRVRVNEMLRREPRVRNFRLGEWNEGGAGVTVVEFS